MPLSKGDLFRFPKSVPNDLEDFFIFYPFKFPPVVPYYIEMAKKFFGKPKEFREFFLQMQKELFAGFDKITKDFNALEKKDLEARVVMDQRLHKLFCWRFWVVNYIFCDGPLHDFYVKKIKDFAERLAVWENIEDKPAAIESVERILMQSDYADLYLQNALKSIKIVDALSERVETAEDIKKVTELVKKGEQKATYEYLENLISFLKNTKDEWLQQAMKPLLLTANVRGDNYAIYNMILHGIEFYDKTIELKHRHETMKDRILEIHERAKKLFSTEEYEDFNISYQMVRNFNEAKDVFGMIDPFLIPFWFKNSAIMADILGLNSPNAYLGHSSVFRNLVWKLPDNLKLKVMNPDMEQFSLETL